MVTIYKNKDVMEEYQAPMCRVFSVQVEQCIAQTSTTGGSADSEDYEDNELDPLGD